MAFYKDKSDMFNSRAERCERDGASHWAAAKNGEGDHHYGQAKSCYNSASENRAKAEQYKGQKW